MFEHIRSQFTATFGNDNDLQVVMAPGRVNLIGEYTDFNEGFVFPMTVDRGVYVGIRARGDQRVRVKSIRFGELIDYPLDDFEKPSPAIGPAMSLASLKNYASGIGLARLRCGYRRQFKSGCWAQFIRGTRDSDGFGASVSLWL